MNHHFESVDNDSSKQDAVDNSVNATSGGLDNDKELQNKASGLGQLGRMMRTCSTRAGCPRSISLFNYKGSTRVDGQVMIGMFKTPQTITWSYHTIRVGRNSDVCHGYMSTSDISEVSRCR